MGKGKECTGFCFVNFMATDHLEDLGVDGRKYKDVSSRNISRETWIGLDWFGLIKIKVKFAL